MQATEPMREPVSRHITAAAPKSGLDFGRRVLAYAAARPTGSATRRAMITLAMITGAALVAAASAIHLHLWATGYRAIPTIGPLFLVQGIVGAILAVVLAATRRLFAVVAAAGFMVATIGGLLLSVYVGLFGFMDSLAAPFAGLSLAVEGVGALMLASVGVVVLVGHMNLVSAEDRG
jgi:hypothetical protein